MYYCLLLILLISPAFGRPGSTQEYVEELRRILSEDRALILNTEEKQAKYEEDKEYTEKVRSGCKIISWFTFGLCSLVHHYVNEVPLEEARVELERPNVVMPIHCVENRSHFCFLGCASKSISNEIVKCRVSIEWKCSDHRQSNIIP